MALRNMKSRYNGKCKRCGKPIAIGDSILWSKATGAIHPQCEEAGKDDSGGSGNEIPQSSGESFKPEIPGSQEIHGESYFTIGWPELRDTVKAVLRGDSVKLKKPRNLEKIKSHTTEVRKGFHGYEAGTLREWTEQGYTNSSLMNLSGFTPPLRDKRHYIFAEDGDELHVDRALSGEDNFMGDWSPRERIPGVAIEAEIMFAAAVNAEIVMKYNVWLCRAMLALESAGIDIQVTLKFSSDNATGEGIMNHTIVKVKQEGEATDFRSFSPMLSPAALRTFGFVGICLHADSRGKDVSWSLGHGRNSVRPTPTWNVSFDPERRVLKFDCPYMPGDFPEEEMNLKLREALRDMKG